MGNISVKLIEIWTNNLGEFVKRKKFTDVTQRCIKHIMKLAIPHAFKWLLYNF